MPSPADRRIAAERACRAGALLAVGALMWLAGAPRPAAPLAAAATRELSGQLARATRERVPSFAWQADSLPDAAQRAWLAALRRAGTVVQWSPGDVLPALALSVEPLPDPSGGARLSVLAPAGTGVRLVDSLGTVDSLRVPSTGIRVLEVMGMAGLRALTAHGAASSPNIDAAALRPVLLLARAGWEGRFAAAALQEAGWKVEADFEVTDAAAPNGLAGAHVRTAGAQQAPDTARFAAVVALDGSAAGRAASIARFVRSGGGLVLGPEALAVAPLAALGPTRAGAAFAGALGALRSGTPRRGLDGVTLTSLRRDALALETSGSHLTVAARREALGRVVAIGYRDTWSWRLQGGPSGPDDHRAWWSALVASVAPPTPASPPPGAREPTLALADPAPLAALVAALGAPRQVAPYNPAPPARWEVWLVVLSTLLLLAEWTSRRTRGAV